MIEESAKLQEHISEAMGIFANTDSLQSAMDELQSNGFGRVELSVMAKSDEVRKKIGHGYKYVDEITDTPDVPRRYFFSDNSIDSIKAIIIGYPFYIAAGAAAIIAISAGETMDAALIIALLTGAGFAIIGSIISTMFFRKYEKDIKKQIKKGGLVLWVQVKDKAKEKVAKAILRKNGARNIHITG